MLGNFNLEKTYQYLLIALAFLMPLTVTGANTVIVIICFLWLFSGDYKAKYNQIISSNLMIASIAFYCLHVIGMLWTEDLQWGLHILHKMWYFLLLLPVLYNIVNKEYTKYYIYAFLIAIALTEILSYLIWFEIIESGEETFFHHARNYNPTPFMSHVSYNPFLAFAIYLVTYEIFINKKLSKLMLWIYSFFSVIMVINMFITGGRAGQVVFFATIAILIMQYFHRQRIKALVLILLLLPAIFFTAYQTSSLFNERVNQAITEMVNYDKKLVMLRQSSIGSRLFFTINSWKMIQENPILGAGTGDFPSEYNKISETFSFDGPYVISRTFSSKMPSGPYVTNPHNMYILVLTQLGIVGLLSMLSIMYYQIKISLAASNKFFLDLGLTLPLLFLVIMWSDSYLLGHYTGLLFVFFSSFLYKDFEKS